MTVTWQGKVGTPRSGVCCGIGIAVLLAVGCSEEGRWASSGELLMKETSYVAAGDLNVIVFDVTDGPREVKLSLQIENDVPLDVVYGGPGKATASHFAVAEGIQELSEVFSVFSEKSNPVDVFDNTWSKRGAFQTFEPPSRRLDSGEYSIVIDNSNSFTPTRGDAIIHIALHYVDGK